MTTLRNRLVSAIAGLGFAVMAAVSPMSASANVVPHTQNIYMDVNQLTAAGHTSLFIQQVAEACYVRVVDYQLQQLCQNIFLTQAQAMNNDRHLIYSLVGTWPNNFKLNATEAAIVAALNAVQISFVTVNPSAGSVSESTYVGALALVFLDNGTYDVGGNRVLPPTVLAGLPPGGAFHYGEYVTTRCQYSAFAPAARAWCASLNRTYGYEANLFENYVTFTFGTPFAPPPPPNPFGA